MMELMVRDGRIYIAFISVDDRISEYNIINKGGHKWGMNPKE